MTDHYYSPTPHSGHHPERLSFSYRGHTLWLETDSGVFSRKEVDRGTQILLQALPDPMTGHVLDMGCGYGAIGLSIGKAYPTCAITLADINQRATALAAANGKANGVQARVLTGDGYQAVPQGEAFDYILQNPPIRAGKATIYQMFQEGALRLAAGGQLWLVIRKQQGAPSAQTYLGTLFAEVQPMEKKSGYWVLRCSSPHNPR